MEHEAEGIEGIRWGRALLAALLVEFVLAVVAAPIALSSPAAVPTLNALVPPASFVAALLVVLWLFRRSDRPIANGVVTGLMSLLIYTILALTAYWLAPEKTDFSQAMDLPYLSSHLLKILGGAAGGYLIARRQGAA